MGKAVNLPETYFPRPPLSRRDREFLIHKAQESAKALVEGARSTNGPIRWTEAGAHNGVQMYRGEARNPAMSDEERGISYACGAVSVQATLEEAADFFDVSTTPKMKQFAATQDDIQDGVVLYTLAAPTPANHNMHQITVKWFLGNMPSRLIKQRDFLTLECQDVFTDTTGRRGWVRSYHSIKLPSCPDMKKQMGFVRGSMYHSGYVFVEAETPGWLDCIFSLQVNLKGNVFLPAPLYWAGMKSRISCVARLSHLIQDKKRSNQRFLSDLELVPKNKRTQCFTCAVQFGVFTRKTRCRKCGEVVCHKCTQTWEITVPKYGAKKVRVCTKCCLANEQQQQRAAAVAAAATATTATTHSAASVASESAGTVTASSVHEVLEDSVRFHNQYYDPQDGGEDDEKDGGAYGRGYGYGARPENRNRNRNQPSALRHQYAGYEPAQQRGGMPPRATNQLLAMSRCLPNDKLGRTTYVTEETASLSSDLSASRLTDDRSLNARTLHHHTRQMGPAGPVTRQPLNNFSQSQNQNQNHQALANSRMIYEPLEGQIGSGSAQDDVDYGAYRQSFGSDNASEIFREFLEMPAPVSVPSRDQQTRGSLSLPPQPTQQNTFSHSRLVLPPSHPPHAQNNFQKSRVSGSSSSLSKRPSKDDVQSTGIRSGVSSSSRNRQQPDKVGFQHPQPHQGSDEDADTEEEEDTFVQSPMSEAIGGLDFSTLLQSGELSLLDSYRFSVATSMRESTISFNDLDNANEQRVSASEPESSGDEEEEEEGSYYEEPSPTRQGRAESVDSIDDSEYHRRSSVLQKPPKPEVASKETVVELYEQILELTKQQHVQDDAKAKEAITRELLGLYQKLNNRTRTGREIEI